MDIRMRQAEALYTERKAKETAEGEKADEASGTVNIGKTETAVKAVGRAIEMAGAKKAGESAKVRQPSYDEFVPEKLTEPKSCGRYQPVSDGKGGVQIQFDAPAKDKFSSGGILKEEQMLSGESGKAVEKHD